MTNLDEIMMADAATPNEDALKKVRALVASRRDLQQEANSLEERAKEKQRAIRDMDYKILPELFSVVGIDRLGLPAEGNQPALEAVLSDYYRANIAADWSEERRGAAFAHLQKLGMGELIRRNFEVSFAPDDPAWSDFANLLTDQGIPFSMRMSVPWQTLTAALRALYEGGSRLSAVDLEAIGATVGQVVKLKPGKD